MSANQFLMPKEELWVRQVFLGGTQQTNEKLIAMAKNPAKFRAPQIVSTEASVILITYEENINDEPTKSN